MRPTSKTFQPASRMTATTDQTGLTKGICGSSTVMTQIITAPPKRLPNSRRERVRGLATSSMMFSGMKAIRTGSDMSKGLVKRLR